MAIYRASKVFVPGGMPQHTYVSRVELDLEKKLASVTDNLCKLVTLTGATKSGKTVLTSKVFPRETETNIWVDGGSVTNESDFWAIVLEQIQGYTEAEVSSGSELELGATANVEAQGSLLLLKGKAGGGASARKKKTNSAKKTVQMSPKTAAITQLSADDIVIVIDDFHYLDRQLQGSLVRAFKPLVFKGQAVVIIAIPHRKYDAVKVEREMTSRIEPIQAPPWVDSELRQIATVGFPLLKMEVASTVIDKFVSESYKSPHLMQEFCRQLCRDSHVEQTLGTPLAISNVDDNLFRRVAEGTGRVIFEKLAKGPRSRTDRIPRPLKGGREADIYKVVLLALARLSPGMEKVNYEDLRASIRELLESNVPEAHEVSRVLEKMAEIASSDEASTPVIDWDKDDRELHVTDPFFAFFLKWGVQT